MKTFVYVLSVALMIVGGMFVVTIWIMGFDVLTFSYLKEPDDAILVRNIVIGFALFALGVVGIVRPPRRIR